MSKRNGGHFSPQIKSISLCKSSIYMNLDLERRNVRFTSDTEMVLLVAQRSLRLHTSNNRINLLSLKIVIIR
jgi:hypothetical protein